MLCPGEEFQKPEHIMFKATLAQLGSRFYLHLSEVPLGELADGNFLGVLITKKGLLALTAFGIHCKTT